MTKPKALDSLGEQGVAPQLLNGVTWSEDRCVHCGACTSVCQSGALSMDRSDWSLVFAKDKCFICRLCVKACPVKAMGVGV